MFRAISVAFIIMGLTVVGACRNVPETASLEVIDQDMQAYSIMVPRAAIDREGWLVLHPAAPQGGPDASQVLAAVYLAPGNYNDVVLPLAVPIKGEQTVFAMLHYDSPADREFNFQPGGTEDPPATAGGDVVTKPFVVSGIEVVPALRVETQDLTDGTMVISSLVMDRPGWLVIHPSTGAGEPDASRALTQVYMSAGEYADVSVPLSEVTGEMNVFAMLHYDQPADQSYTFQPGGSDDPPVMVEGNVVVQAVTLRGMEPAPAIEVEGQEVQDGAVVVARVMIDKPGWLVLHPEAQGGGPDAAAALALLYFDAPGEYRDIEAPFTSNLTGEQTVYAMLHYDDPADGDYTFAPGETDDPPVIVEGNIVVRPFTVRG